MFPYQILTDSAGDLTAQILKDISVASVPLTVTIAGETRQDTVDAGVQEFYARLRSGEVATTAAANPSDWEAAMEPILSAGDDLLVIAFSSGLSTTYQSACIAAEEMQEKYPQRSIRVVDSRCASLGQGLFVWYAAKKRAEGLSLDELAAWCEENRGHLCHWFTVDDLMFLKRGGRISAATAVVGTMLAIKPVLHVDDDGHLINVGKARGRRGSLDALVQKMAELKGDYDNSTVFICHGDCIQDAEYVAQKVKEQFGVKEVVIGYTGAVIGSHSGPGTLALFFLGEHR